VTIPFPDGSRVHFNVHHSELRTENSELICTASVIKDAGNDPDVTHGAEIVAEACLNADCPDRIGTGSLGIEKCIEIVLKGGIGVGRVTKPGLAIPVGEPAINPVPRKMIRAAVLEALTEFAVANSQSAISNPQLQVTISVPAGEELAKRTLNHRLGIVGGISILGTTGIVRPLSSEAWTATISASMDVAKAMEIDEIAISSGRVSEKAHIKKYHLPEESYVMMGDYLEFALREAEGHGFIRIHLCAQWAKMLKIAMATPQTHVRHGAIDLIKAVEFLNTFGVEVSKEMPFNTAREIFDYIKSALRTPHSALSAVCIAAKRYAEEIVSGVPVIVYLVSYEGDILADSE